MGKTSTKTARLARSDAKKRRAIIRRTIKAYPAQTGVSSTRTDKRSYFIAERL